MHLRLIIPPLGSGQPWRIPWEDADDLFPRVALKGDTLAFPDDDPTLYPALRGTVFHRNPDGRSIEGDQFPQPGTYVYTSEPPTHRPWNYQVVWSECVSGKEASRRTAVLRAIEAPWFIERDEPPTHFDHELHTSQQCWEFERDCDGESERAAIAQALEKAGIHFRPATAPSDYSPTGRWCWHMPEFRLGGHGHIVVVSQLGLLDV